MAEPKLMLCRRYIAGILIKVVGFAGAVGTPVPQGATYVPPPLNPPPTPMLTLGNRYLYNLNFFTGFLVSSGVYFALCRLSPIPATAERWMEVDEDVDGRNASLVYGAEPATSSDEVETGYGGLRGEDKGGVVATGVKV